MSVSKDHSPPPSPALAGGEELRDRRRRARGSPNHLCSENHKSGISTGMSDYAWRRGGVPKEREKAVPRASCSSPRPDRSAGPRWSDQTDDIPGSLRTVRKEMHREIARSVVAPSCIQILHQLADTDMAISLLRSSVPARHTPNNLTQ